MRRLVGFGWLSSGWRWLAVATLALALVSVPAASAASTSSATIVMLAPGAPQGAIVNVQWLDPLTNLWVPVDGWTGTLNQSPTSGAPYQAFAVLPDNYGQSSFRWVVYNPPSSLASLSKPASTSTSSTNTSSTSMSSTNMSSTNTASANTTSANTASANTTTPNLSAATGSLWGMSLPFALPSGDGVTLQTTILPMQVLGQLNGIVGTTTNPVTTGAANTVVNTSTSMIIASLACPAACNASAITAKFTGLPMSSWITVEWLDSSGIWEPVAGWQGHADFVDASGKLVKQFGVFQANYGQGPFRWAVYNTPTNGSLIAVSPNFNLPTFDGENEILNLAG